MGQTQKEPKGNQNKTALAVIKSANSETKEVQATKVLTIAEKVEKINRLSQLSSKRADLYKSVQKLDAFSFGSDRMRDRLTIEDGEGNVFETSNSAVIEEVTEFIKERIFDKVKEVETEIDQAA